MADSRAVNATQQLTADQKAVVEELERQKRAKSIAVPTDDVKVRVYLRALREPITLFGEGNWDRRERLRRLLVHNKGMISHLEKVLGDDMLESEDSDDDEEFFTRGPEELLQARQWIAEFSLYRAKERLECQRKEQERPDAEARSERKDLYSSLKKTGLYSTQIGSERPLSSCAFSPDSSMLLTGCFGGSVKLWSVPSCQSLKVFKGKF